MAVNAIALVEIVAWLDLMGIEGPYERRWFVRMIRAVDQGWLAQNAEEQKRIQKAAQDKHANAPRHH